MKRLWLLLTLLLGVPAAHAHLGSKDVFQTINAGPYTLYVTVRPPNVIPGVATVEVRSSGASGHRACSVTPLPLTGEASKHPPAADLMHALHRGPGVLHRRPSGSWRMRNLAGHASTSNGVARAAGRVGAGASRSRSPTLKMQKGMGAVLRRPRRCS